MAYCGDVSAAPEPRYWCSASGTLCGGVPAALSSSVARLWSSQLHSHHPLLRYGLSSGALKGRLHRTIWDMYMTTSAAQGSVKVRHS